MKILAPLERDSANSQPGDVVLQPVESSRGEFLVIALSGPDREIWISREDLLYALEAPT